MNSHLIFFYGTDCPHCDAMRPLLAKLCFETGVVIDERDIWKSEPDRQLLEKYQGPILGTDPECGGLPFFYNTETTNYLCGEVSYKKLKDWAVV